MTPHADSSDPSSLVRRVVRDALGEEPAALEPMAGHLGLRAFVRVRLASGETLVARIEAPEDPGGRPAGIPPEPPLEPLRAFLERAGLPVPARRGGDPGRGVDLLEDLGTLSLEDAVAAASPAELRQLYEEACDLAVRLQGLRDPGGVEAFGRRLDAPLFRYKADLFATWSVASRGRPATPPERAVVRDAFERVARESAAAPARLSHRDLQSHNLLVRRELPPGRRLAMVDLQGAFLAPPEYDLVCLLRDSYVALPEAEVAHQLARVRPALPDAPGPEEFARRFDLLTLTRKGKDHARFLYAAAERGDRRFLRYLPHTRRVLQQAAARAAARDPAFAALAELMAELPEAACGG